MSKRETKEKDGIRQLFIPRRKSLEQEFIGRAGGEIAIHLENIDDLVKSARMAAFRPSDGEPDIGGFLEEQIKKGKEICFPRFDRAGEKYEMAFVTDLEKDFRKGHFGILEPLGKFPAVPSDVLENIPWIVPGVAFDSKGGRLGHGKGIFDRLLRDSAGIKIGICYDWQIVDVVPSGKNDVKMDFIVTESGIRVCS